jgi:hypothetical protein
MIVIYQFISKTKQKLDISSLFFVLLFSTSTFVVVYLNVELKHTTTTTTTTKRDKNKKEIKIY